MSKRQLKALQRQLDARLQDDSDIDIINRHQELEDYLFELEKDTAARRNSIKQKNYEWIKWLVAIAAGVFSVIVTQISKMSSLPSDQLFLMKVALSANALGILLGAIYLYTDIRHEKDIVLKLLIYKHSLLLNRETKITKMISSESLKFSDLCKPLSLMCFLAVIVIWVWFVWQIQVVPPLAQ